ncbi:MAG: M81 family metallopeptidase [Alphaproteobacteria bacterium]
MRVLIAMMKHETNTFSPVPTDLARFDDWGLFFGADAVAAYRGTGMPLSAYLDLAEAAGAEVVTPVAAEAMPSGPVHRDAYERLAGAILDALDNDIDVALLDLHGAMVAEHLDDGEGELLRRMRARRPGLPIAVTCDLHCNLTAAMVDNCTALIGYKTYPHTDMHAVAAQVGRIVLESVAGRCRPVMAWGRPPLLSQTLMQGTDDAPMRDLVALARAQEARPGVLAATVFGGFPHADIADAGNSAIVVADGDPALAEAAAEELVQATWARRADFVYRARPLAPAVAAAKVVADGPVALLDHADNCGSGGTQDDMTVIGEVLRQGLEDVAVAAVWDPQAVEILRSVGEGARVALDLGGRTDMPSIGRAGRPLRVEGVVSRITDGSYRVEGPMYTGVTVHMGPTAVLDVAANGGSMRIVIVSRHHEPWDAGLFHSVGIEPSTTRYLLLKSRIHYRAGMGPLVRHTFTCDGNGVTTSDNAQLHYRKLRRPIFPLDPDTAR